MLRTTVYVVHEERILYLSFWYWYLSINVRCSRQEFPRRVEFKLMFMSRFIYVKSLFGYKMLSQYLDNVCILVCFDIGDTLLRRNNHLLHDRWRLVRKGQN